MAITEFEVSFIDRSDTGAFDAILLCELINIYLLLGDCYL